MKIKTGDIYREQIPRYQFAKKFVSKKILDVTYGKYLDYFKSELFLNNGATYVWSYDLLDNEENFAIRQFNDKKKIYLKTIDKNSVKSDKFNFILAFNILSISDNYKKILKNISDSLESDGTLIISVLSKNLVNNISKKDSKNVNFFTKEELDLELKNYFNKIDYFVQGNLNDIKKIENSFKNETQNKKIKSLLRKKLREFFLKSEKRRVFFIKHIQPKFRAFRKKTLKIDITESIPEKYNLIPMNEKQNELFIIAMCKK